MRSIITIVCCLIFFAAHPQQNAAFTQISTEDGAGLASNVVYSLYQDHKGYIWVGTANGLQRFDGSKFISFGISKTGSEALPQTGISQIIPADSGRLMLVMASKREVGLFDPSTFIYKKIRLITSTQIPPRSQLWMWKASDGHIFINVSGYGLLMFDKTKQLFSERNPFHLPKGWVISLTGIHEDTVRKQILFATNSGLCVYDRPSDQLWHEGYNPTNFPMLNNKKLQDNVTEVYIDRKRRLWVFGWSQKGGGQYKYCLDSTGTIFLEKDTIGLHTGPVGYTEYTHFYEPAKSDIWIYGSGVLFNWDRNLQRFYFNKSTLHSVADIGISYESVYQLMDDKDGSLWIATDHGLYFTPLGSDSFNVVNLLFKNEKSSTSITDILELPNGDIWFASWGEGVRTVDKLLRPLTNNLYKDPFPKEWNESMRGAAKLTWSLCRQTATGEIWVGCNDGKLLIHDPQKSTTKFLDPPECNNKTIRFIAEDKKANIWLGTQGGRLIRFNGNVFNVVQELGSIIYKIFVDRQGWLWIATHEKGLFAVDPVSGNILQHYSTETEKGKVYSNTAFDIEQLNDSIIIYGGGVLNFINKKSGAVRFITYAEGLPSNNVIRLRMDKAGFLWIITSNGLCRYNPNNNRITPYGRKDGILLGEQTTVADYATANGDIIFGGNNAVVMFRPAFFSNNQPPPDVAITDFQLFSNYVPVDSLLLLPAVKLLHDQNSITIHFACLSYMQRDKLTYYYKMEGLDDDWIKADRGYLVNYSLLPPGKYTFKIYCENLEGMRSMNTTSIQINIKPPFWKTWWFRCTILFVIALVFYDLHNARVKRLLAVEKLRNKVARDLHDDMGSTLSTINILTAMAKTKMNTDVVKTTEYLGKISDNSQRMMEAMDDIVWSIKPSNDSMSKVIARMREFATHVLEAKEIDVVFTIDENVYDQKLNMEARKDFFLIFKESINNAAKYSKADKVVVEVSAVQKKVILSVIDNGVGFNVDKADSGNGLGNMQKRAEAMSGSLKIDSGIGLGTKVMLKIPVG